MYNFNDKAIIVTGSSRGIGRAVATNLLQRGARVVLNARNSKRLASTVSALEMAGYETIAVAGDVTCRETCEEMVRRCIEKYGKVDALINNAGMSQRAIFQETDPDSFHKILDINVMGSIMPTRAALSALGDTKGSVVFVSSLAGIHGMPGAAAYSASKMALTAIAECLRIELKSSGIHVGIVYVGLTKNDPEKQILTATGEIVPITHPVKPHSTPEKVARQIAAVIARRKFKTSLTPAGFAFSALQRVAPRLVDMGYSASFAGIKKKI